MPSEELDSGVRFLAHEELREGQVNMINDAFGAITDGGFLLANAPTGIGKTAASLAAALTVARGRAGAGQGPGRGPQCPCIDLFKY